MLTPENYIFSIKSFEKRKLFTKLRISSHDLHIETGRYSKPNKTPVEERICTFCSSNKVEDEYHTIMECSFYADIRGPFLKILDDIIPYFNALNNEDKFIFIMSFNNGDTEIAKIVVDFVHQIWNTRKG